MTVWPLYDRDDYIVQELHTATFFYITNYLDLDEICTDLQEKLLLRVAKDTSTRKINEKRIRRYLRAALRHAETCPNVTGRTKERVAQSKRARTGLLATID